MLYDGYVAVTDKDILLPDGKFYSIRGRYIALVLAGHTPATLTKGLVPGDRASQAIFADILAAEKGRLPPYPNESTVFTWIIGFIYLVFGYVPLGVRIFNIVLSLASTYLVFRVAERQFGEKTAAVFLAVALFLPTQVMYSITLTRDFLRMFVISVMVWVVYGKKG